MVNEEALRVVLQTWVIAPDGAQTGYDTHRILGAEEFAQHRDHIVRGMCLHLADRMITNNAFFGHQIGPMRITTTTYDFGPYPDDERG
jgi:hypothetical protein